MKGNFIMKESKKESSEKRIIEMLNLFYANKHMYEKVKRYHERRNKDGK